MSTPKPITDQLTIEELKQIAAQNPPPTQAESATQEKDRLTVLFQAHYEQWGEETVSMRSDFSHAVPAGPEPWSRRTQVGPEWVPLSDLRPWLDEASMCIIHNRTGLQLPVQPTEEAALYNARQIVHVRLGPDADPMVVRPGRIAAFEPYNLSNIALKCAATSAKVTIYLFPRA